MWQHNCLFSYTSLTNHWPVKKRNALLIIYRTYFSNKYYNVTLYRAHERNNTLFRESVRKILKSSIFIFKSASSEIFFIHDTICIRMVTPSMSFKHYIFKLSYSWRPQLYTDLPNSEFIPLKFYLFTNRCRKNN